VRHGGQSRMGRILACLIQTEEKEDVTGDGYKNEDEEGTKGRRRRMGKEKKGQSILS